ncbi:MAG: hypothetical protein KDB27_03605 [Planctomycetales bacterium]|nr:hypothetical protein [Planctomycetales bacterium]
MCRPQLFRFALSTSLSIVMASSILADSVGGFRGDASPGNRVSPNPATPLDTVSFSLNTDSVTYGNECVQESAFDGQLALNRRDDSRLVSLELVDPAPQFCTFIWLPVTGIRGELNSLQHGNWLIEDGFGNSVSLTVVQEGDANKDGIFNSADFVQVFQAAEYEDDIPRNSTWEEGDWTGDQEFTSSDFVAAFKNYRPAGAQPVQVPEPLSLTPVLGALILLLITAGTRKVRSIVTQAI